jgi:hypothetical protein
MRQQSAYQQGRYKKRKKMTLEMKGLEMDCCIVVNTNVGVNFGKTSQINMNLLKVFDRNKKSSGVFIPKKTQFIELKDEILIKSINGITEHLGYHSDQSFSYYEKYNFHFDGKHCNKT